MKQQESAGSAASMEEIEFRFAPSFRDATLIWLARLPDGEIRCAVHTLPEMEATDPVRREWKKLKEVTVSPEAYARLSRAFEEPAFRLAAEQTLGPGADGTTWIFRKKAGSRQVEYNFWSPEVRQDMKSSAMAMALGRQFAAAAAMDDLFAQKKKPNKAPEPTPGSVTPRAIDPNSK
jgi:hypothetical protein